MKMYMEGIADIRDNIITIINLKKRMNLPLSDYDKETRVVIVKGDKLGFVDDEVSDIITVQEESIFPSNSLFGEESMKIASQIITINEDIIFLLNVDDLIRDI